MYEREYSSREEEEEEEEDESRSSMQIVSCFPRACHPRAYYIVHRSRRYQKSDLDVLYVLPEETKLDVKGSVSCVALCSLDKEGHAIGEKRVDMCFPLKGQTAYSQFGKFSVIMAGEVEGEPPAIAVMEARQRASAEQYFNLSYQWSFDFARACNLDNLQQAEADRIPPEFYWYSQAQHSRALSEQMFEQHLLLAKFHLLEPVGDTELLKEMLTTVAHQCVYMSDRTHRCDLGVSSTGDSSESLLNQSIEEIFTQDCSKHIKVLGDTAQCPLEVRDHSLIVADCEDDATLTGNQVCV